MLYPQLLGGEFETLPRALRDFHSSAAGSRATGAVNVRRENAWLAGLLGFPPAGEGIPICLEVICQGDGEIWIRRFGSAVRRSLQRREGDLLLETLGPVRVFFRIFAGRDGLRFRSVRARLWMLPVPLHVEAHAWSTSESSWEFQVSVARVGSYRGVMVPAA